MAGSPSGVSTHMEAALVHPYEARGTPSAFIGDDDHCLAANEETSFCLRSDGRAGPAYGPWQFAVTVSCRAIGP
jgi:hypothetical protein